MDYFDYSYKHDYIEFSSTIYKVGTYYYNWHGETEILILLKGRVEMSCNNEVFTMEPLDAVIISPQIMHNLAHPGTGDWIQPLVAAINCTLWVAYGLFKEHRDIPVALANAPGIFFGLAAAITAVM